jgi:cell division septation protein DedD
MQEDDDRTHEILLENRHLALVGAGVVVLCVGAFFLGRWSERSRWVNPDAPLPQVAEASEGLPIVAEEEIAAEPAAPAEDAAPPQSGAAGPAATGAPAPSAEPAPAGRAEKPRQTGGGGEDLYIQVLATRQAEAAQALRDRLAERRYPATILAAPDAQGRTMYRVRVGGFESRAEAERVAARLQKEEKLRTWIP